MSAKWLGVKKIRLDRIVLPGGFAKRKKQPHVADLAESIKRGGVINLPVVDEVTRKLVAGGDRLAALQLLGVTHHEVRMVRGTPADLEITTIQENLWRRRNDDYDGMTKRMIELTRGEQAAADAKLLPVKLTSNSTPDAEPARPGRPKTEHGAARDEVAAKLGKTPEAVRQAEKRARQKEAAEAEAQVPEEQRLADKPPVTTYGVVLDVEFSRAIVEAQEQIDAADSFLRRAQGAITTLERQGSLGGPLASRIQAEVHRAADAVRRARPDSVCPCCKLIAPARFKCAFCGGVGVVSNEKLVACAPELLVGGDKAMVVDLRGGFVPYSREAGKPAEPPAKAKPRLRVTDDKGNPIHIDDVPAHDVNDDDTDPF